MLEPQSYEFLDVSLADHIALAMIDRPEQNNSPRPGQSSEFTRFLGQVQSDEDVYVAVLAAKGSVFCPGGGIEALETYHSDQAALEKMHDNTKQLVEAHIALDKPVVSALNGLAAGVGAAFALFADFVVADRSAELVDAHVTAGLVAGDGGVLIWPLSIGMVRAKKYMLTGDRISADEAERIGLVSEVVDDGQAMKRAFEIATRLAGAPQAAIRGTKRSINQHYQRALDVFRLSCDLEEQSFRDPALAPILVGMREGRAAMPVDPRAAPNATT